MAEAWVATFKAELVDGRRFSSFEYPEHEVLDWIGFYNDERLHEALDDIPPSECEAEHYRLNIKTDNIPMLAATYRASKRPRVDQSPRRTVVER